jgi:hypothetical protein
LNAGSLRFGGEVHFVNASGAGSNLGFPCAYTLDADLDGATEFTFAHRPYLFVTLFEPFDKGVY